jgi:hypothetical protein
MNKKLQKDITAYKAAIFIGIILVCVIGIGSIGFFLMDNLSFMSTTIETPIPIEKIIEMTFSASGMQTAAAYSPTSPPTATLAPAITLLPTITLEPTMTFQLIPTLMLPTSTPTVRSGTDCNPGDQLPYVYSPDRLVVLSACIHVTGVIKEVRYEDDGDLHILLKLDRDFQHYLKPSNPGNTYLVVEPVCVNKPTQPNAIKACALDPNPLKNLPKVGDHVWMEGRYVTDTFHNGWAEIHPLGSWGYH